jgi:peptidoglycan/xylan/chitin deacetylase (PgdA/CDA1 family)
LKLCRADKFLLAGGATVLGSAAVFGPTALGLGLPAGAMALLMADGVFRPESSVFYPTVVRGRSERAQVALTFDDGPDPEVTPAVLDALAEHQARATFFVIGRYLEKNSTLAERMLKEGHELGNHSWQHSHFQNFYPAAGHAREIDRCSQLIRSLTKSAAEPLYRPPVGLKSPAMARVATRKNLTVVAWSIHGRDTFNRPAHAIAEQILARIQPGDIVLLHDGHDRDHRHRAHIQQAMPLLLQGLRERGLASVPVSELLADTLPATPAPSGATLAANDGRN